LADPIFKEMVLDGLKRKDGPPVTLVEELRYDAINVCDLIITSSGTATLEAALLGVPMIIIYRTSAFTWWISRLIVKTRFAGMPNIILKRPIVKELLQGDLGPKEIKEEAIRILDSEEEVYRIKRDLSYLVPYLGEPGAIGRARDIILSYL
jgi:lipid-A-disaccharide synthase